MKQTAVEWLVEKIQQANPTFKFDALIRESKAMEKEQHKKTWSEGMFCETGDIQAFEQYYEQTFKSE